MKKTATKTKAKHAGGRPTKYSPLIIKKTKEYIASCKDEVTEFWKTRGEKSDSYDRLLTVKLPTVQGLALHLGINEDTIVEWGELYPEFSASVRALKSEQARRLIDNGLSGDYNPQMAKFLLSANHGLREKSDVTSDDKPLPQPIIYVHRDDINTAD